jgi:hypothetical protein
MDEQPHVDKASTSYQIDGKTYASLDEMPPEVRKKVESVLVDRNNNGVPDIMEDFMPPAVGASAVAGAKAAATNSFEQSALAAQANQARAAAASSDVDRIRKRQMVTTAIVTVAVIAVIVGIWLAVK